MLILSDIFASRGENACVRHFLWSWCLGRVSGVLELTVVLEDVPLLVPVNLLRADLLTAPKSTGPTWVRLSDPSGLQMTKSAQHSLHWLLPRVEAIPTTALSLPPYSHA